MRVKKSVHRSKKIGIAFDTLVKEFLYKTHTLILRFFFIFRSQQHHFNSESKMPSEKDVSTTESVTPQKSCGKCFPRKSRSQEKQYIYWNNLSFLREILNGHKIGDFFY